MTNREFLEWIYARLVKVHGENELVDYMHKLKSVAAEQNEIERLRNLFIETAAKHEGVLIKRDDEIERLRDKLVEYMNETQTKAAEIERLRKELAVEKGWVSQYRDSYGKQVVEIERLRERISNALDALNADDVDTAHLILYEGERKVLGE